MIKITHWEAIHEGGTKFYRVFKISNTDGGVVVTNWGKVPDGHIMGDVYLGAGQFKLEYGGHRVVNDIVKTTLASKSKRGYNGINRARYSLDVEESDENIHKHTGLEPDKVKTVRDFLAELSGKAERELDEIVGARPDTVIMDELTPTSSVMHRTSLLHSYMDKLFGIDGELFPDFPEMNKVVAACKNSTPELISLEGLFALLDDEAKASVKCSLYKSLCESVNEELEERRRREEEELELIASEMCVEGGGSW